MTSACFAKSAVTDMKQQHGCINKLRAEIAKFADWIQMYQNQYEGRLLDTWIKRGGSAPDIMADCQTSRVFSRNTAHWNFLFMFTYSFRFFFRSYAESIIRFFLGTRANNETNDDGKFSKTGASESLAYHQSATKIIKKRRNNCWLVIHFLLKCRTEKF